MTKRLVIVECKIISPQIENFGGIIFLVVPTSPPPLVQAITLSEIHQSNYNIHECSFEFSFNLSSSHFNNIILYIYIYKN